MVVVVVVADPPHCVSSTPGTVSAGAVSLFTNPGQMERRGRTRQGVQCDAKTLAMDQCRKWLTKWRLESPDFRVIRGSPENEWI